MFIKTNFVMVTSKYKEINLLRRCKDFVYNAITIKFSIVMVTKYKQINL